MDILRSYWNFSIKHLNKHTKSDAKKVPWRRVICNSKATPKAILLFGCVFMAELALKLHVSMEPGEW